METITSNNTTEVSDTAVSDKVADMEQRLLSFQEEFLTFKNSLSPVKPAHSEKPNTAQTGRQPVSAPAAVVANSGGNGAIVETEEASAIDYEFQPLSVADESRAKKLLGFLQKSDMRRAKTLFIMDSNGNNIKDKELDPDGDCKAITSGGLCLVAAAQGLKQYGRTHRNIRKLIYVIGTNDQLHTEQHVPNERINYIKTLYSESRRVFPNAQVNLVLPFGGTKIDPSRIELLAKDITSASVGIKQYKGPNMHNKLSCDKLHMNAEGKSLFKEFLRSRFIPKKAKPFSAANGRPNSDVSSKPQHADANPVQPAVTRTPGQMNSVQNEMYKWPTPYNPLPVQPPYVREIMDAVAQVMSSKVERGGQVYQRGPPPGPSPYSSWFY